MVSKPTGIAAELTSHEARRIMEETHSLMGAELARIGSGPQESAKRLREQCARVADLATKVANVIQPPPEKPLQKRRVKKAKRGAKR